MRKESQLDLLHIPYTFKGAYSFYPSHIVVITLDKKNGQVQYYDPQALPPDHPDRLHNNLNMLEALQQIRKQWEQDEPGRLIEIVANPIIHQEDIHSCGVYIVDYINQRQDGKSFEFVCLHGKNAQEIIEERDEIARQIVDAASVIISDPAPTNAFLKEGEDNF
ncbi:MAG: Ulp1 family isopeptidase [Parachlamydiaceae bacterium]